MATKQTKAELTAESITSEPTSDVVEDLNQQIKQLTELVNFKQKQLDKLMGLYNSLFEQYLTSK